MTVNPGPGAIEGPTELDDRRPATLDKLAQGLHRDVPRAARRRAAGRCGHRSGGHVGSGQADVAGPAGRSLQAGQAATGRRNARRGLPGGRPGRVRSRDADRHRLRDDADGLRDSAAAPARGGLQGDHEPDVAGAAQPDRRAAGHPAVPRRPTTPKQASTRPGFTFSCPVPSTPRRSRRPGVCCPACSPTPARLRSTRGR